MDHTLLEGGRDTGEGERREGVDKPLGEGVEGEERLIEGEGKKGKKGRRDRVLGLVPPGTLLYAWERSASHSGFRTTADSSPNQ